MKVRQLVSKRFKETPADCQIASQALMIRGGYIKQVGNGIYSLFPAGRRVTRKIEAIIRQEMDRIGGQEVLLPVAMPASLWRESGRFESVGSELLRFKDRSGNDMVLGMTHEEAAVHLMRDVADSYTQYPFMIYQLQTKFRDEPRARGGLIRVREFVMKDAYSFHTSLEDLQAYYMECYHAYERIFARAGVPEVIAVESDSGMMGGKVAHEFMLCTDAGEDTLVLCDSCDFKANMEAAPCIITNEPGEMLPLERVATPGTKTIEDLCIFLGIQAKQTCKAVLYQENASNRVIVVFVRGDLEVNETKLRNLLGMEVHPAVLEQADTALTLGFIGPKGLPTDCRVVFDRSLEGGGDWVTGANEIDWHLKNFNLSRDVGAVDYVDVAKAGEGTICPNCGKPAIKLTRGIEVGNIFQLGIKYSQAMGMQYVDADGTLKTPIMGCYGIGVGRLAASVCEAHNDQYGPLWPMSIAPWHVQICALKADDPEVYAVSENLYQQLQANRVEVLWDERPVSAGVMFSDADLLGAPLRIVVSPKGLKAGTIEVAARDKSLMEKLPVEDVAAFVTNYVKEALAKFECTL